MSLLDSNDLKERQKINELQLKINREKQKLDKKLTRQKILLGAFMIELLETNKIDGLAQYTADNLEEFLTRQGDKELMGDVINNLKSQVNKVKNIETHI
jgi:di/tricarboxylate transporter